MIFELKIALRFLKDGRGQTTFILLGIAIGVAVQVFLGTLISGLQRDLVNGTVGSSPHMTFSAADTPNVSVLNNETGFVASSSGNFSRQEKSLDNWKPMLATLDAAVETTAVSPVAEGNGFLIKSGERWPILVRGIEPQRADLIYDLSAKLSSGRFAVEGNQVLIGTSLADEALLQPGDTFTFELPGGGQQSLTVAGVFDLGNNSLNETWLFMELGRAQRLLGFGDDISRVEVQIEDVFAADQLALKYEKQFIGVKSENWKVQNASLLSALTSQSSSSLTIQAFVLLAITLGIASVLAVSVVQKSKQIGILKAMGTSSSSASRIFLLQGGILGFLGSILGSFLGYALTQAFLWGTSIQTGEALFPLQFDPVAAATIIVIATTASILSALLPARRSANLNPIDVIRG
ncbi:ABC transporter permease [Acidaminobacter hydrogenoformans]|uniref:Lipoprotein-releasing system permease protein n=1 Tax=Acidaminobacter hydrogenoformans DSM 2784 TaxID=1120920 RepID=A0A1G5S817_9FIRM|nr:FtsX-like permease family protein [Acidaminobacter hydrogenoformans]SCZ81861.1 lipoprotein-releasing system permease protein [Acidaminobacter hydrogenoformans DSM 2784]